MHNIFFLAVRLGSEAAVWRGSKKHVLLLYDEKSLDKFRHRSSFLSSFHSLQACNVDKNELVHGYFSMIFIGNRGGSRDFEKGRRSMSTTMADR